MGFVKQNSITIRIEKMRLMWQRAMNEEPSLIIWQVKAEESEMVDAFYLVEESEDGRSPELFFQLDPVFTSYDTYSTALMDQLVDLYEENMKYYTPEGMGRLNQWKPLHRDWEKEHKKHPSYILENLSSFAGCVTTFEGEKMVIYLPAPHIHQASGWERWWKEAIEQGIPANLVLMVRDVWEDALLDRVAKNFPRQIQVIKADLELHEALKEEAKSAGDPNDPAVLFRLAILTMAEAAAKKDAGGVHFQTGNAVSAAKAINNPDLQAVGLLAGGIHLFNLGKKDAALEYYRQASSLVSESAGTQQASAQVAAQVEAAKGALFFYGNNWQEGWEAYRQMAQYAQAAQSPLLEMEGWRMAGYCAKKNGNTREAFQHTEQAYHIGKAQQPEAIPYTTFPFIGEQLIELSHTAAPDKTKFFEEEIIKLLGHEWRHRLQH